MHELYSLDDLPRGAPVYLFGAGHGGEILFKALTEKAGVPVEGFIDNYRSGEFLGKKIVTLDEFVAGEAGRGTIVVASQYFVEIGVQLRRKNVRDAWNGYPLIHAHLTAGARRKSRLLMGGLALAAVALGWAIFR